MVHVSALYKRTVSTIERKSWVRSRSERQAHCKTVRTERKAAQARALRRAKSSCTQGTNPPRYLKLDDLGSSETTPPAPMHVMDTLVADGMVMTSDFRVLMTKATLQRLQQGL